MKKLFFSSLLVFMLIIMNCWAHASEAPTDSILPFDNKAYSNEDTSSLWAILKGRVEQEPFNLVATIIFLCAVINTFFAAKISTIAKYCQNMHEEKMITNKVYAQIENRVSYKAEILHILGDIEVIFALWLIPLVIAITYFFGWHAVPAYLNQVNYVEPIFVVAIMAIAATKPIIKLAEACLKKVAKIGKSSPAAWWLSILTLGPLIGSLITEPAAMTISAMLLAQQFYILRPSTGLAYATLGLLFVNISIGGTLTHFAAPPILMVANTWNWDIPFMLTNFSWKVLFALLLSNMLYYLFFQKEFKKLKEKENIQLEKHRSSEVVEYPVPYTIIFIHILFLAWTIINLHSIPLVIGGFMVFLACTQVTMHHQYTPKIRGPLLVGLFLAGLVTHGTLQQWWIEPLLGRLSETPLFIGSLILTMFNDNAAITFLASLVPSFVTNIALQKAVVYGAVAGGGLTVIANAPNPAGQSILSRFFPNGVSPVRLFLGALIPTVIVSLAFMLFP